MVRIAEVSASDPTLLKLIITHQAYCADHTPEGSGHAVAPTGSDLSGIRYWMAFEKNDAVGCIGLKAVDASHSEIKTMHVLSSARGKGIGGALVDTLVNHAKAGGAERLSLETGNGDGFASSRRLYEAAGFNPCEPFGHYAHDPFSYCMTMAL